MAVKSRADCDRYARASNTLNGPTTFGMPGNPEKPKAARFTCSLVSETLAVRFGKSWLNARKRDARLMRMFWSLVTTPRLYFTARVMASSRERGRTSAVAFPVGILPWNESSVRVGTLAMTGAATRVGGALKPGMPTGAGCWAFAKLQQQAIQIRDHLYLL